MYLTEKYWEEPFQFRPERFVKGDYNKDAFIPFSAGPRACIGRRFVWEVTYVYHASDLEFTSQICRIGSVGRLDINGIAL